MSKTAWAWARPVGGVAILAILVWRLGTGPILDGLRTINGATLVVAAGIAVVTTVSCAWRWTLVARGLGVGLPLRTAIAAYYRSQFLNTALPGGVLGDVHRAVSHGRDVGDVGRSVRSVVWERFAGQAVQAVLAVLVLVALPSPVRRSMPIVIAVVVVASLGVVLAIRVLPQRGASRWARTLRTAREDVHAGLLVEARPVGHRARVGRRRGRPHRHIPGRRPNGRLDGIEHADAADRDGCAAGDDGTDHHRRLGPARRRRRMAVRGGRTRSRSGSRSRHRLRRHGDRRQPAGRRSSAGHLASARLAAARIAVDVSGRARSGS